MSVSRLKCRGKKPAMPKRFYGLKPGEVGSVFTIALRCGLSLQEAQEAFWQAMTHLDISCSRCRARARYRKATRAYLGKLIYECPRCEWQIEMPLLAQDIPPGEAAND